MQPLADARWMHDDRRRVLRATPFLLLALLLRLPSFPLGRDRQSFSCRVRVFPLVARKVVRGAGDEQDDAHATRAEEV